MKVYAQERVPTTGGLLGAPLRSQCVASLVGQSSQGHCLLAGAVEATSQ